MSTPATICGQGVMAGQDVQAKRKRPGGRRQPPRIMGGSRVSGVRVPEETARVKVVRVWCVLERPPRMTPRVIERKGRPDLPLV